MTTLADLPKSLYGYFYGTLGSGKTHLITTLGVPFKLITAEPQGAYGLGPEVPRTTAIGLIKSGKDPFEQARKELQNLAPDVKAVSIDGMTVIFGLAVDYFSGGSGERQLQRNGWGQIYNAARQVELEAQKLVARGIHVIMTAWQHDFKVDDNKVPQQGGPVGPGQGGIWLPGNTGILGRMYTEWKKVPQKDGTVAVQGVRKIQTRESEQYIARNKWEASIPPVIDADLKKLLEYIK